MKYPTYERYKDSGIEWLGKVPDHWPVKKLKWDTAIFRGASPRPIDDPVYFDENGEYAWVRIADVTASGKFLYETTQKLSPLGASLSVRMAPDSLFLSIAGSVGKPCITKIKCCIHDGFVYFPFLSLNQNFLYYIFAGGESYKGLGKMGTQLNLNTETVGSINIPVPPNEEQQSIANFLDRETSRIDALIKKKQKLIEQLKEKRIALISQAVTKGLNPNVQMKDSGIEWLGMVPMHWDVKRLRYLSQINPVASEIKHLALSDEVSFVPMDSISENGGMKTDITKELENVRQGFTYFKENDVVIAKITPCFENGKGSIAQNLVNGVGFGTTELHVVRCNSEHLDFKYFFYVSNSHQFMKLGESEMYGAGGQKRVPTEFIKDFPVAHSKNLKEQHQIVHFLDEHIGYIISIIDQTQKTISKLTEYKTALISATVTGKIRVTELVENNQPNQP